MVNKANYVISEVDDKKVVITDVGPWDTYQTITNAAELVVQELLPRLGDRRLFYYDSDGDYAELIIVNNAFYGYKPAVPEVKKAKD